MKKINYPSDEWVDRWIEAHPDSCISDAEAAWWDAEINKGNPTPFDLSPEQEQASKKARKGIKAVNAYGKEVKRERKPNEAKRTIIDWLRVLLEGFVTLGKLEAVEVTNIERSIDFKMDGKAFTLTLTEHRPKKGE